MAESAVAIARRRFEGAGHATIRPVTVEVIFQKCPGARAPIAISGLEYEVQVGEAAPQRHTTGADGKVTVQMPPGGTARVTVMGTEYRLSCCRSLEAVNTTRGIQRRLQMLGYYVGTIDGVVGQKTEYAVLGFQADNGPLKVDGLAGTQTQNKLRTAIGE